MTGVFCIGLCMFRLHCTLNIVSYQSPTLNTLAVKLEHHEGLQLCHAVSELLIDRALNNEELTKIEFVPEPVPLCQEMLTVICWFVTRLHVLWLSANTGACGCTLSNPLMGISLSTRRVKG